MLLGKLKNPKIFTYHPTPSQTINIETTCISVVPIDYVLGGTEVRFFVDFNILKESPSNPSSLPLDAQETKMIRESVKRFDIILKNEDLANWDSNDESLLNIIAAKFNLELESFFTL